MTGYERIYKALETLLPDVTTFQEAKTLKARSMAIMALHVDLVEECPDGGRIIALAHYYEQNGDLLPDPDMTVKLLPSAKMAQALTYQDSFGYQAVYPKPGYVNLRLKKELNSFLEKWLRNIRQQGHQEAPSKELVTA